MLFKRCKYTTAMLPVVYGYDSDPGNPLAQVWCICPLCKSKHWFDKSCINGMMDCQNEGHRSRGDTFWMLEAPGGIYFIRRIGHAPIKIGFSKFPGQRIRAFQTASDSEIEVLAIVPGSKKDEKMLHRRFRQHRIRGEWFSPSAVLLMEIAGHRESHEQSPCAVQCFNGSELVAIPL